MSDYDYINPNHYQRDGKQTIEIMEQILGENGVIYGCFMNAIKYLDRNGFKPGEPAQRDVDKAKWYLDRIVNVLSRPSCKYMLSHTGEILMADLFDMVGTGTFKRLRHIEITGDILEEITNDWK